MKLFDDRALQSVSEVRNLFPRLRFGLVSLGAAASRSGPRGIYTGPPAVNLYYPPVEFGR